MRCDVVQLKRYYLVLEDQYGKYGPSDPALDPRAPPAFEMQQYYTYDKPCVHVIHIIISQTTLIHVTC